MTLATVIIPTGQRHLSLLPRAVESVYAQTVQTDVLTFLDTQGKGPAYGRNLMAAQVTTPFLVMLDADDYLEPDFVEKTIAAWHPGSYVYTDWYQGREHNRAHWCYPFRPNDGERTFHLPVVLMPTAMYRHLGGMDESLFGAEDTDFFWRANARLIRSIVVREPLFTYTSDGFRSKEAGKNPKWAELLLSLRDRYREDITMACCGEPANPALFANEKQGDDILVRPKFTASQLTTGRITGRKYGRLNRTKLVFIDPRDFHPLDFDQVDDWTKLGPVEQQITAAKMVNPNDPVAVLEQKIVRAGVRIWGEQPVKYGFDIQQTPRELAEFLAVAEARGVKRVLEIGTGESAGLARFLIEEMGYDVVSVDVTKPEVALHTNPKWTFVLSDSKTAEVEGAFDAVIIDGDHSYAGTKADWERYASLAPLVALHDIAPDGWWGKDDQTGGFWREISRDENGKLRAEFTETISTHGRQGLGWRADPVKAVSGTAELKPTSRKPAKPKS